MDVLWSQFINNFYKWNRYSYVLLIKILLYNIISVQHIWLTDIGLEISHTKLIDFMFVLECLWSQDTNPSHIDQLAWNSVSWRCLGLWTSITWPHHVSAGNTKNISETFRCVPHTSTTSPTISTSSWIGRCCHLLWQTLLNIFLSY